MHCALPKNQVSDAFVTTTAAVVEAWAEAILCIAGWSDEAQWGNQWEGCGMNRTEPTGQDFSFYDMHDPSVVWLSNFIKIKISCKHKHTVWHLNCLQTSYVFLTD
jgi:hypothetical protein